MAVSPGSRLAENASNVGFIVHRGDTKDGTDADRFFNPSVTPEIWLQTGRRHNLHLAGGGPGLRHHPLPSRRWRLGISANYNDCWGLHLWGDAIDPSEATELERAQAGRRIDDYRRLLGHPHRQDATQPVNFIVHQRR